MTEKVATFILSPLDKQKIIHFINFTKADVIVKKNKVRGANVFYIFIKCLGKSFEVNGNYIDVSEERSESYYKDLFLSTCANKTMDHCFSFYTGSQRPEYFNRDILTSIESKLKLW